MAWRSSASSSARSTRSASSCTSPYQRLKLRHANRDVRLEINCKREPLDIRAVLHRRGARIELGANEITVNGRRAANAFIGSTFINAVIDVDTHAERCAIGADELTGDWPIAGNVTQPDIVRQAMRHLRDYRREAVPKTAEDQLRTEAGR